jgi:hypothetical protein
MTRIYPHIMKTSPATAVAEMVAESWHYSKLTSDGRKWKSLLFHKTSLRGFGPRANYADRATAASW